MAVNDLKSLSTSLGRLEPGSFIALQVEREGVLTYLAFQMGEAAMPEKCFATRHLH